MSLCHKRLKDSGTSWTIGQWMNRIVWYKSFLYYTLTRVVAREKENEDKTTRVMAKLLEQIPPPTEGLEPSDPFIDLLMWLAIVRENSWACENN